MPIALQDLCLPEGMCYGCGSANPDGLHIKSYWSEDGQFVVARFEPQAKFSSGFRNALYGGLIASLIDCHSNWTAMAFGYQAEGREPGTLPLIASVTGIAVRPVPQADAAGSVPSICGRGSRARSGARRASCANSAATIWSRQRAIWFLCGSIRRSF